MAHRHGTQELARELNTLESVILSAEDSAEDARWHQASNVAQLLDGGWTQREIAAEWHSGRTGKPYSQTHVTVCKRVWDRFESVRTRDRPSWGDAYATVKEGADEVIDTGKAWGDRMEARAPKSAQTADRLAENLLAGPSDIVDRVADKLNAGRTGIRAGGRTGQDPYVDPTEAARRRKEADTYAKDVGQPIVDAFSRLEVVLYLESALDTLRDMTELEAGAFDRVRGLLDELGTEAEVKRAMAGIR